MWHVSHMGTWQHGSTAMHLSSLRHATHLHKQALQYNASQRGLASCHELLPVLQPHGRLFELFLRNQTGVFAEGRKNKCLGAYIVTSNVFLSMLYPDQLRHLRQQKSHHPYIRERHRPQMTQRYSHVSSWHLEAAQERLVQKLTENCAFHS